MSTQPPSWKERASAGAGLDDRLAATLDRPPLPATPPRHTHQRAGRRGTVVLLLLLLLMLAARLLEPQVFREARLYGIDLLQGIAPAQAAPTRVAVVRIGETSLARNGAWPWPRDAIAELIEAAEAAGAEAVVLDLLLDTPSRGPALAPGITDPDQALATALARRPAAVATAISLDLPPPDDPPLFAIAVEGEGALPSFPGAIVARPELRAAAVAEGASNAVPEHDMVMRRAPLLFFVGGRAHPALPVAALAVAGQSVTAVFGEGGLQGLRLGTRLVRTDAAGRVHLDFGRRDRIPVTEASLLATEAARALDGRIAVIGVDVPGVSVSWRTADGGLLSGPETVAVAIDALLTGSALSRPAMLNTAEHLVFALGGAALIALFALAPPYIGIAAALGLALAWPAGAAVLRGGYGLAADPMTPVVLWFALTAAALAHIARRLWRARAAMLEELHRRTAEAEAANRAKLRFLREMNHDLRTPLNAVLGFASLIDRHTPGGRDARLREYARAIALAGTHILSLSQRALRSAEIGAVAAPLEPTTFEVARVIDDAVRLVAAGTGDDGARIDVTLDRRKALLVRADRTYLLEAVMNLIDNAVRHTPEPGRVTVSLVRSDTMLHIDIIDEGPGLPIEVMEAVGKPFLGAKDDSEGRRGFGLGLYIAKTCADRHNGALVLTNRRPEGLRARLTLPVEEV